MISTALHNKLVLKGIVAVGLVAPNFLPPHWGTTATVIAANMVWLFKF